MLIRNIVLEDFGLYAGRQVIDVQPTRGARKARPIILVGGKNGAGKTSLLEAVRLTLYGKLALGERTSQSAYEDYLRSRVHTGPSAGGLGRASVGIEFEFAESGVVHIYEVSRAWTVRGNVVQESMDLRKNGETVTVVPRNEWQNFLHELLPVGVSQLFFFDGEKITEIAEDSTDGHQLSAAIRSLLGIDLVGRLRTDLGLYLSRNQRSDVGSNQELETILAERDKIDEEVRSLSDQRADLQTQLDGQRRESAKAQQRFTVGGGEVALRRSSLTAERSALDHERTTLLAQFKEGSSGLWPWLVAPTLVARLQLALAKAGAADQDAASRLQKRFNAWQKKADAATQRRWTQEHKDDFQALLEATFKASDAPAAPRALTAVGNATQILTQASAQQSIVQGFAERLRTLEERIGEIDTSLARVDETTASYLLDELRGAEQSYGQTQGRLKVLQESLDALHYRRATLDKSREKLLISQAEDRRGTRQTELASRIAASLAAYETALIASKVRALEVAFVDCFNRLARKGDLVREVRISADNFQATLIGKDGAEIPRVRLSAGEKQVFAIAILWALAKTSGRSLPVIIDTPLARLDSDHRAAILERYLPEVSHQVVVLSTDTEVDVDMVGQLSDFVAQTHHLQYLPDERRTAVATGYFKSRKGASSALL
ncbi:DNA sulfur modification protein DndD [Luteimonas fraxinea]|uniref:DNA sulfur modification protein DndD n=1 Tax=Luteimonas fraxinea TaxID=2901869 RepID=UPI001E4E9CCC|nr:DNA sulfur modification protein DndD [Luteimonas fraxinea]UHH10122.1 DNA sulfur modification protein DndD [Luteimonas fraxinea]